MSVPNYRLINWLGVICITTYIRIYEDDDKLGLVMLSQENGTFPIVSHFLGVGKLFPLPSCIRIRCLQEGLCSIDWLIWVTSESRNTYYYLVSVCVHVKFCHAVLFFLAVGRNE